MTFLTKVRERRKRWSAQLKRLRRRARNSVNAFRTGESSYQLAIGNFYGFEVAYRAGSTDEEQIRHSFDRDIIFRELPEYSPSPDHVIVDVGAHIGTFALFAASKVRAGHVYAIEPNHESYNYLRINVALNRMQNIMVSRLALSDRIGSTMLYYGPWNLGHSITQKGPTGEKVPTETLASYFAQHGIDSCDLLKMNCEGAEFPILFASTPNDLRRIDTVLIQYHGDLAPTYKFADLERYLQVAGFTTRIVRQKGLRGWLIGKRT